MKRNSIVDLASPLIQKGYQVVPITMSNGKPLVDAYADVSFDVEDAKGWREGYQGAGIAVICGRNDVYCLDFDVDDLDIATKLRRVMVKNWPNMPLRSCNPGRFAALFKAGEDLTPVSNGHSDKFKFEGKLNCIELAGNGLLTLYGKHRKTNEVYRWGSKLTPHKIPVEDLPTLSLKNIQSLFNFYTKQVGDRYAQVKDSGFSYHGAEPIKGATLGDDGILRDELGWEVQAKTRKPFDDDKVRLILQEFQGHDRDDWLQMGMAMHINYAGSDTGFDMWHRWSADQDGYVDEADCRYTWKKCRDDKANPITLASFWKRLREKKRKQVDNEAIPQPETLEDFEERYVFIRNKSRVGDLKSAVDTSVVSLADFRNDLSGLTETIQVTDGRSGQTKDKQVELVKQWERSKLRKKVYEKQYYPSGARIVSGLVRGDREKYYNTYSPPFIVPTEDRDLIHYLLDHLKYLFPNEGDVHWMVNWLAQLIQDPLNRHRVAPLSISTFHGTGRGWLGLLMMELVGKSNVSTLQSIGEIIRDGAKTGFLDETTLCLVNETYSNSKEQYNINDRLRNLLGDNFQSIDVKYGAASSKFIYTRFFFQSNHVGALALDDADVRIEVFLNHNPPKEKSYYSELYPLLKPESDFVDQVYSYLNEQTVDESMLQESRRSESRATMLMATKSPTGSAFYEFKQLVADDFFTDQMMKDFMASYTTIRSAEQMVNPAELTKLKKINLVSHVTLKGECISSFKYVDFHQLDKGDIFRQVNNVKDRIELYKTSNEKDNESI